MTTTQQYLDEVGKCSAKNYKPLAVVLEKARACGCGTWRQEVPRLLSAYSALNQGTGTQDRCRRQGATRPHHATSRAPQRPDGPFLRELCALSGFPKRCR